MCGPSDSSNVCGERFVVDFSWPLKLFLSLSKSRCDFPDWTSCRDKKNPRKLFLRNSESKKSWSSLVTSSRLTEAEISKLLETENYLKVNLDSEKAFATKTQSFVGAKRLSGTANRFNRFDKSFAAQQQIFCCKARPVLLVQVNK